MNLSPRMSLDFQTFDTVSKSVSEMNQKRAGTCMPAPKFVI